MITWRKSSYSASSGACVELTHTPTEFGIRDSKNTDGPMVRLAGEYGLAFLGAIKSGRVVQR
jgi:hypothetical protein